MTAKWKLAASATVLALSTVAYSTAGLATSTGGQEDARVAAKEADKATRALSQKRAGEAVAFAEAAVAASPRNADYRMLLGQAYLAAGRFKAAETSFADTLSLDPERGRAALNLSLAQTALGQTDAARATLAEYRDKLPAADHGLALALAGDAEGSVQVLETAARGTDATAKTRQNLALAYALAGQWRAAKTTAEQDLSPLDAAQRVTSWAAIARPDAPQLRVAGVLGVTPVEDAGQATRLALAPTAAPASVQVVVAEPPAPAPVVEAAAATEASAPEAPAPQAPAFEVASVSAPAPAPVPAVAEKPAPAFQVAPTAPVVRASSRKPVRAATVAWPAPVPGGRWVVQLGAFSTTANAQRGWSTVSSRYGLGAFSPYSGTARAQNADLTRVAVSGFATRDDAARLCAKVRSKGGVCFVRMTEGDQIAQWLRKGAQIRLAAR